jgi:uncharacterized membrane protein YphA (DoxX/SURF4 family)
MTRLLAHESPGARVDHDAVSLELPLPTHTGAVTEPWSFPRRFAFRAGLSFTVLFLFPFPLDCLPIVGEKLQSWWNDRQFEAATTLARLLFHIDLPAGPQTGSGDMARNYATLVMLLTLAVVAASVWSYVDRRRTEYVALDAWLRVVIRYSLASSMLGYGCAKVFKSQFPFPGPTRLLESVGEMSPMGLLWTFMGYSTPYTFFAGAGEVVGALLLFSRRTATLGALVCGAVMTNVVMLNFCYDVPVKLYSSMILGMAIYVAAPDAGALVDLLVTHRPTTPRIAGPFLERTWARRLRIAGKAIYVAGAVGTSAWWGYTNWYTYGDRAPRGPIDGAYEVESLVTDDAAPPAEGKRWRQLGIKNGWMVVIHEDKTRDPIQFDTDAARGVLKLKGDLLGATELAYTTPDAEHVELRNGPSGVLRSATLKKVHFLLVERGFHWVNEGSFNK